jgi:TolB-like protein/DNA-binding SARP family transcriptional activator/tetratricopeptide (TPR) repeat protein
MATRIALLRATGDRRWRISTGGRFALVDAATGQDASPPTRKARAILAFLCFQAGQHFTREKIATLLWGDRGEAQARASLRQALLEIRHATATGPTLLQSDREHIWAEAATLEPEALDETSWAHSDELLFDDLDHVSPDFDEWLAIARAGRNSNLAGALQAEIQRLIARGRGAAALPLIDRLDRLDPLDESTLRLALRAEYQAGRVAGIERRVRDFDCRLQEELGVRVSSESKALRDELIEALGTSKGAPRLRESQPTEQPAVGTPRAGDRKRRWGSLLAAALLALLALGYAGFRTLSSAQETAPTMLAVLPFEASHGTDGDFAEGLSDELIAQLARNRGLRVIGRTSAWQYKGKAVDLRTIGRQLGAEYLVEGDVSQASDRMRVSVSLIRARDGTAMWSRVYRATAQQTPFLRGTIGGAVVAALGLPEEPAVAVGYKPDGEAYALYLRARTLFRQRNNPSLENARTLLLEAIRIDPKFAPPWAYAGWITFVLGEDKFPLDPTRPDGPSMSGRQAVEHALVLDPNLADAHGLLGMIEGPSTVDGFRHLQRAVQLAPNDPQILFWYSRALRAAGDYRGHAEVARKAVALDPLWRGTVFEAACVSLWAGDRAAVRRYLDRLRAANPRDALEVEADLADQNGNWSRLIEIAVRDPKHPRQDSTVNAGFALMMLGFEREGRLVGQFGRKSAVYDSDSDLPPRSALLELAHASGYFDYGTAFAKLRRRGRYGDIAAVFDDPLTDLPGIQHAMVMNRQLRMRYGGQFAQALFKVGRKAEGAQMLKVTEDADAVILASGNVYPCDLASIAANDAVAGRKEDAIRLLQRSANFYCPNVTLAGQPDPMFDNLRGDPRFEQYVRLQVAHLQNERRKVIAMNLF